MNILIKTLGFSLALILTFTAVSYVLPQMKGEAPVEKEMDVGALTMDSFIAMGKDLYQGKGTCTLCHNQLGRAPDLLALNVEKTSLERLADSRYRGKAKNPEGYLRESMLEPNIYVVKGFGKKGTNDAESPMPAIDKPPAQLSQVEIDAIIAYLQHKDGNQVTVVLPTGNSLPAAAAGEKAGPATPESAQSPEQAFAKFGCVACHSILKTESSVGPNLNDVGKRLSIAQIRESIIAPGAVIAKGYPPIMPDLSEKMTIKELEIMAQFLAQRKTKAQP
jgi:mono/diheme cytochrome c family protein